MATGTHQAALWTIFITVMEWQALTITVLTSESATRKDTGSRYLRIRWTRLHFVEHTRHFYIL
jgi:hypothetical protein